MTQRQRRNALITAQAAALAAPLASPMLKAGKDYLMEGIPRLLEEVKKLSRKQYVPRDVTPDRSNTFSQATLGAITTMPKTKFRSASWKGMTGLGVTCTQAISNLGAGLQHSHNGILKTWGDALCPLTNSAASASRATVLLEPYGAISNSWQNHSSRSAMSFLSRAFLRYRVKSMTLRYVPIRAATTNPGNFTLGFSEDPANPNTNVWCRTASQPDLTPDILLGMTGGKQWSNWMSWSQRMPVDTEKVYYTYVDERAVSIMDLNRADWRNSFFGSLTVYANGYQATTADIYGTLWADYDIEFYDLNPEIFSPNLASALYDDETMELIISKFYEKKAREQKESIDSKLNPVVEAVSIRTTEPVSPRPLATTKPSTNSLPNAPDVASNEDHLQWVQVRR